LNRLVMNVVSLPMLVNVAHFCVGVCVINLNFVSFPESSVLKVPHD